MISEVGNRSTMSLKDVHTAGYYGASEGAATVEPVVLGICTLSKKAGSKQMREVISRLKDTGDFEIVVFDDETILNEPIENWPVVQAMIAFYSEQEDVRFPLHKACAYAELRKPFLVNDLQSQHLFFDRRQVYKALEDAGIPVPPYVTVNRDEDGNLLPDCCFEEHDDSIVVNGVTLHKTFVEKPVSGEDHNINIYYPISMGGGSKSLFRKKGDRSAEFKEDVNTVRKGASYMYENFLPTGGTDVKVYTVGPLYAHAEARKAPTVDGKVLRDEKGKEVRYPVLLTNYEKEIARKVTTLFKQNVCGFDLLRSDGKSYVCDVNGWSFVKSSKKFYEDAVEILHRLILARVAPARLMMRLHHSASLGITPCTSVALHSTSPEYVSEFDDSEELRSVIAVCRHGDRTPKQKMKVKLQDPRIIALLVKHGKPDKGTAKLKKPEQLKEVVGVVEDILANGMQWESGGDTPEEIAAVAELKAEAFSKLLLVRRVLSRRSGQNHFSGINRKIQIKVSKRNPDNSISEVLFIVKHGGVLTKAGRQQGERLGNHFRRNMYISNDDDTVGDGLLRLHSTFRHDLKIYSSDEGRVQMTAAAFAKALLSLEGTSLAPILVSLVEKDSSMLDAYGKGADSEINEAKRALHRYMTCTLEQEPAPNAHTPPNPTDIGLENDNKAAKKQACAEPSLSSCFAVKQPLEVLEQLLAAVKRLVADLDQRSKEFEMMEARGLVDEDAEFNPRYNTNDNESIHITLERWRKLESNLCSKGAFDISKIPDIYDMVKYDLVHNFHLQLDSIEAVYRLANQLAADVVPSEYGIMPLQKLRIGSCITHKLLRKIMCDFNAVREETLQESHSKKTSKGRHTQSNDQSPPQSPTIDEDGEMDERRAKLNYKFETGVKSNHRHVRTRLYFTSESHIHGLLNVLRFSHLNGSANIISMEGRRKLECTQELDYLSHIVFRIFEITGRDVQDPSRFRVEVLFSEGAHGDPIKFHEDMVTLEDPDPMDTPHVLPTVPMVPLTHTDRDVSMQMVLDILGRAYVNDKSKDLASDDELWSMLGQQRPVMS